MKGGVGYNLRFAILKALHCVFIQLEQTKPLGIEAASKTDSAPSNAHDGDT